MADKKISQLTAATTPLDGTEVLPIVQSSATVKVANNDLRPKQIQSNATSGVLQIAGPAAASTRVMTVPNADFTAARTDAAQTFSAGSSANIFDGTATEIIGFSKSSGNRMYVRIASNTDESLSFVNSSGTAVATVGKTGDFSLPNGNFIPSTAAKGINFTANTAAAGMTSQLLNWYEEGTWTATLASSGGGSVSLGTSCVYTRIGRVVNIIVSKYALSLSGLSAGNLTITGLPFTCSSLCDSMGMFFITGTSGGANTPITASAPGSTTINLYKVISANENVSFLTVADLASTISIAFSLTYIV